MAPAGSANTPEATARIEIDRQLEAAGWTLQHRAAVLTGRTECER
ncbi:MAG TPA: hypothetical protein VGK48_25020 [Terriglobia bacterium]